VWTRVPHNPMPYDDDWEDQPAQSWFHKWVMGVVVPGAILWCAVRVIASASASVGANPPMELHGKNTAALGTAGVGLSVFLHCHYFWGNIYNQIWFAVLGKIIGAMAFIAGLGVILVRVGVYGLK